MDKASKTSLLDLVKFPEDLRKLAASDLPQLAAELRQEIDRILDKVNREGMTALTDQERKFLKRASKKLSE